MVAVPSWMWGCIEQKWHWMDVEGGEDAACSPSPRDIAGPRERWSRVMLKSHLTRRRAVSYNQSAHFGFWYFFFNGDPAHLLGFYSLLVATKTQPGWASQAALSYLLLRRRVRRLRAGLKWLFSSRSLRKNKIWFAIPCGTCAGSSAPRARDAAFCPLSVCD